MAVFSYKGVDRKGKEVKGVVEASSRAGAIEKLKSRGIFPYEVKEEKEKKKSFVQFSLRKGLSDKELLIFFRTLAAMLEAGIPLTDAITAFSRDVDSKGKEVFLTRLTGALKEGKSFKEALELAGITDPVVLSLVQAGEKGGMLPRSLKTIAQILERKEEIKHLLVSALIYPTVLILVALGTVVFMMVTVIPKVTSIYKSVKLSLPLSTRITLGVSNFLIEHYALLVVSIFVVFSAYVFLSKKLKNQLDKLKLRLPVVGKFLFYIEIQRFLEILGSLVSSGIPIVEAIPVAAGAVKNSYIAGLIFEVKEEIKKGIPFHRSFSSAFPRSYSLVIHLIKTGEETGLFGEMLLRASHFIQEEIKIKLNNLTSLLEPAMMLLVGLIIGFIVYSLLLPVVSISTITGIRG
ncbi:type II secretion system F family protein [Phorcysia thermohydrogeniphila]|uniref:General secretion pathway protein F/type IV pilus assembly protein PilC n=1 Tax=Phorcysia thermohydrogeniphila TaxID=936138 RepID=A0A4R1GHL0_9BACT|nr:type II secretion system F family protein [Phorcysia thermohydrogeniphila]TCK06480.1 general secretion pathway protein F/type IV pilus assembly protein PilC [Phorcysia thermohydrogeniphila]